MTDLSVVRWTLKHITFTSKGVEGQTIYNLNALNEETDCIVFDFPPSSEYYMLFADVSKYEVIRIKEILYDLTKVERGLAGTPKFTWPRATTINPIEFVD